MMIVNAGDAVAALPTDGSALRVGPGLHASTSRNLEEEYLVTARPGILRHTKGGKLWVEARSRRYAPTAGDTVVGVVVDRRGDGYSVDVRGGTGGGGGGSSTASAFLPALAFEGATRRSRPSLKPGDAVYCRVSSAESPHVEAELTCVDEGSGRSSGLGPLGKGVVVDVTTSHARALLAAMASPGKKQKKESEGSDSTKTIPSSQSPIVAALAATGLAFEVAVGSNGRVWVGGGGGGGDDDASALATAAAAARAIRTSDVAGLTEREAEAIARSAVEAVRAAGGAS